MDLRRDVDLAGLTTFGLPARARHYARITSHDELAEALAFARSGRLGVVVLGGGSNLVLTRDVDGLVLHVDLRGLEPSAPRSGRLRLRVAAGEDWPALVETCLGRGWHGLENLAAIPGRAGAAPVQNIGAYGVELAERLVELEAVEIASGEPVRLARAECAFGYRDSAFKQAWRDRLVITALHLELDLAPGPRLGYPALAAELESAGVSDPGPADVFAAVCRLRRARLPDPARLGNAGSFFSNPIVPAAEHARLARRWPDLPAWPQPDGRVKLAAGWLIERCGLRGLRDGAVGVSERHALVLVNHGGASGRQVLALGERVRSAVRREFGLELPIEPRVI